MHTHTNKHSYSWKVAELVHSKVFGHRELELGQYYGVYVTSLKAVLPFRLVGVNIDTSVYTFKALSAETTDITATSDTLPYVYPQALQAVITCPCPCLCTTQAAILTCM